MLLEAIPHDFCLSDVCRLLAGVRVSPKQDINPRLGQFFTGEQIFEL